MLVMVARNVVTFLHLENVWYKYGWINQCKLKGIPTSNNNTNVSNPPVFRHGVDSAYTCPPTRCSWLFVPQKKRPSASIKLENNSFTLQIVTDNVIHKEDFKKRY